MNVVLQNLLKKSVFKSFRFMNSRSNPQHSERNVLFTTVHEEKYVQE